MMNSRKILWLVIGSIFLLFLVFKMKSSQDHSDVKMIEPKKGITSEERPKYKLSEQELAVNQARFDRYYSSYNSLKSVSATSSYANGKIEGTWDQVQFLSDGQTGYGFRVDGSVYDKENDVLYAISYAGHIWKVNRDGDDISKTNWQLMNHKNNFLLSYIDGLNINNGSFRMIRSSDNGMQYSDNEGRSWLNATGVSATASTYEGAIAQKEGQNRIFVIEKTSSSKFHVFVSSDNGISYNSLDISFDPSTQVVKMFKVLNSESVFIAVYSNKNSKISIYECCPESSDFEIVNTSTITFVGIDRIFGTYFNEKFHFYVTSNNTHIYYSGDKGESWQVKNTSNNSDGDTNPRTVHPTKPNVIFKGYLDVNMSTNYGVAFTSFKHLLGWDVHHMKMYQKNDGSFFHFVGMDFGCYVAELPEYRTSYEQLNNTAPIQMCYDADHCQNYYYSYSSTQDRGTVGFESSSNQSYLTDVKTTDGLRVVVGNNEQSVWTWMYYGTIFRKANMVVGNSQLASINFTGNWWAAPMVPSPNEYEDAIFIASGSRLIKMTYNSSNNSIVKTDHYVDFGTLSGSEITGFAYSHLNTNKWYISVKSGDFYYSNDGGQSFNKSDYSGLFPRANDQYYNYHKNQHVIKASNIDSEKVYYAGVGNKFMISTDGGKNFENHSKGLNIYRIRDFDLSPDEKFIFAACAYGGAWVYSVDDDMWYEMNDEAIPYVSFNDVEYMHRENTVNFATYGNGILKLYLNIEESSVDYPDSLIAKVDNNNVQLTWKDNSNNEIAFIIQRAENGVHFKQIASVADGHTSFSDTKITDSGLYTYRVKAITSNDSSAFSNYSVAKIIPEGFVSNSNWKLVRVTSEERNNYGASLAFDGDEATMWHTDWMVSPKPSHPHALVIDMNETYKLKAFSYLPRQDNQWNGTIKDYEFYISTDNVNWTKVASGTWAKTNDKKIVEFSGIQNARYIKLVALSEVNGAVFASCAEISVYTQMPEYEMLKEPQFVQGGRINDTQIELIWLDMSNNEDGFEVQQFIDGEYQTIYTSNQNVTSYKLANTNENTTYHFRVAAFNSKGYSAYSNTLSIYAKGTVVGIEDDLEATTNLKVYPNPFTSILNIKTEEGFSFSEWKIYDMSGSLLKQGVFSGYANLERIDVTELNRGDYVLRLVGEQGVVSKTIIKK